MRIQWMAFTMLGLLTLTASGCSDRTPDAVDGSIRSNALPTPNIGILDGVSRAKALDSYDAAGLHDNTFFQLNDEMSDVVIHMPGVQSAYVMMTDRNAYVAVNRGSSDILTNGPQLPDAFLSNVSDAIRSRSPSTRNVFVSEDPVLWSRMQTYTQAVREGYPLRRYVSEFNTLVQHVFPDESSRPPTFR
ncbi:YhcN/YlaJ family sporulation lipoprotein [Cohnella panacarvi]|uniref:YhcN/YlaJ family sporulation lipoprotein n=1 Tax=Cohnella panacarvi TaxID=400776 RepID=UPI00047D33E1|nr:YhcN/YlaJ family sporulation lipoprotein [Cohnella panacarvi]